MFSDSAIRVYYGFLLFLGVPLYFFAPREYSPSYLILTLCLVALALLGKWLRKEPYSFLKLRAVRPSVLFIIGFLIVHFQRDVDLLLGYFQPEDYGLGSATSINRAAVLSFCGFVAFLGGMSMRCDVPRRDFCRVERYSLIPSIIFCVCLFVLFLATVNWSFFQGGHIATIAGEDDSAMGTIGVYSDMILQAGLFVPLFFHIKNLLSEKQLPPPCSLWQFVKGLGPLYLSIAGTYSVLMLLAGRRSVPLAYFLLFVFSYFAVTRKKVSKLFLLIAIFVGGVFMYGVAVARSSQFYQAPLSEKIVAGGKAIQEMAQGDAWSVSPVTSELAGSVRSLHVVMGQVPNQYPYTYGRMALSSVTSAVPFLNSYLLNGTLYSGMIPGSARYATYIDQGDKIIYGIGSTIILDFFFDGGLIPVIVGMFLVGIVFRKVDVLLWSGGNPHTGWLIIALVVFAWGFFSLRGSFIGILKSVFYIWIFVSCLKGVSRSPHVRAKV